LPERGQYGPRGFVGGGTFFDRAIVLWVSTAMADGTRGNRKGDDKNSERPLTDETALSARLTHLDERLSEVRRDRENQSARQGSEKQTASAKASAMARGFRLSSELVAGVVVGAVIGWGIDRLLSTSPWGLIVFFLLGFVAGVLNLMRVAGVASGDNSDRS
jgi:ATP synthase protein I